MGLALGNQRLGLWLQRKLSVSQPQDIDEQEADRVADEVMRMPEPAGSAGLVPRHLQRVCSQCEAELDRQAATEEDEIQCAPDAQALATTGPQTAATTPAARVSEDSERRIDAIRGAGQPLPEDVRAYMEPRFGYDFSGVRVHNDSQAHQLARSVNAVAFTVGQEVVFGAGAYAPESDTGRRLLAHELTHVIQQGAAAGRMQRLIRTPYPWLGIITPAIGARIRSSPDSSDPANILDAIPRGQTVQVLSASGNWLQVESRYRGPPLAGYIHHTLVDDAASSSMAGSVGTTMVWRPSGPGSGTDFETWASALTEAPFPPVTATTRMNCWEAVLLAAYRAGAISWSWIHHLYVSVPTADWVTAMTRGARQGYAVPGPNPRMPQRGDLVFFNGLAHVALATGSGSEVYTFWPPPNTPFTAGGTTDKVKVFTIEALVTWWTANLPPAPVVEFAAPAW
jgi:cell wall-associated NlpC family hydrolase